jgi:hypothetical protein
MIRVLVMANDSLLADAIASMLAKEIDLDVTRVTRRELGKGERYSVVIFVDEGEPEDESIKLMDLFRDDITLLLIRLSLKSRNIYVYESYQLNNPGIERVIDLVRQFGRANLKKKVDGHVDRNALMQTIVVAVPHVSNSPLTQNA